MKHKYSILAAVALAISACLFSGCASIKTSLANEDTVKNYATMIEGAGSTATALALAQYDSDTAKRERVAKIMVIAAEAVRVVGQSDDATPATLEAAVSKALCNESGTIVTAVNSAMKTALALYANYYNQALSDKIDGDVILSACRRFLTALATGVETAAAPYSGLSPASTGT